MDLTATAALSSCYYCGLINGRYPAEQDDGIKCGFAGFVQMLSMVQWNKEADSMDNIIEYIRTYGQNTFAQKPFNEVDSLVI